jgi:hypothetical protein
MALVRFGGGVSELRGSIAGQTFSRTGAGAVVRNRIKPVATPTPLQTLRRSQMETVMNNMRTLSNAQIEDWISYAETVTKTNRLGESYTPSWAQVFQSINMNMLLQGDGIREDPPIGDPVTPSIDVEGTPSAEQTAGFLTELMLFAVTLSASNNVIVEATLPLRPSVRNFGRNYRQVGVYAAGSATDLDLLANYQDTFSGGAAIGAATGEVIGVRYRVVGQNGLSSSWVYDKFVIVTGT